MHHVWNKGSRKYVEKGKGERGYFPSSTRAGKEVHLFLIGKLNIEGKEGGKKRGQQVLIGKKGESAKNGSSGG